MTGAIHSLIRPVRGGSAIFLALLLLAGIAFAQSIVFPKLTGRVVDEARLLDAQTKTELESKLAALEVKTTHQLVVVTLRSLSGHSIEDYGVQLGRYWQIGQKGKNNGVILIVAPNEHKVRIEVGYGLEGALPDAVASLIIQSSILPRFKANDFPGGIRRGVEDIMQVVSGEGEEWKRRAVSQVPSRTPDWFALIPFGLFGLIFSLVILSMLRDVATALGIIPKKRKGMWRTLDYLPSSGSSGLSSSGWSSSGSSGGFSGGGGSFGGGGSSGSW
jgi:uncharacterized protein